jgi:hypothetical protein
MGPYLSIQNYSALQFNARAHHDFLQLTASADRTLFHHIASTSTSTSATPPTSAGSYPPAGTAGFSSSEQDVISDSGSLEGPTCLRCTLRGLGGESADALSDILLGMVAEGDVWGVQSVVVSENRTADRPEQEIFSDGSGSCELWDMCDAEVHMSLEVCGRPFMWLLYLHTVLHISPLFWMALYGA